MSTRGGRHKSILLMNSKTALSLLQSAIYMVNPDYIYYGESLENSQVERCFAYELYHQWRCQLDKYCWSHPNDKKIYLNGEIPKNVGGREKLYPDLVLHSGQSNEENQILACEIKRAANNDAYVIIKDIYKLLMYLEFYKNGDENIRVEYEEAVFIMVDCKLTEMKQIINRALNKPIEEFKDDKQEYVMECINKIKSASMNQVLCIAIAKQNNEGVVELKLEKCRLDEILEFNKEEI